MRAVVPGKTGLNKRIDATREGESNLSSGAVFSSRDMLISDEPNAYPKAREGEPSEYREGSRSRREIESEYGGSFKRRGGVIVQAGREFSATQT
jgi:hypothetical protein